MSVHNSIVDLIRSAVVERPNDELLRMSAGSFTRQQVLRSIEAVARGLLTIGVEPGDRVGLMSDNRPEAVWAWLGTNTVGAIDVPFNAQARGRLLDYLVQDAGPRVLIGTEEYLTILAEATSVDPDFVVCLDTPRGRPFGDRAHQLTFAELTALGAASDLPLPKVRPDATATIMYTSGTTGPSKGVMLPQRYYPVHAAQIAPILELGPDDVVYCAQPLFHIDARSFLVSTWHAGGTVVIGDRFRPSTFWDQIRKHGATAFGTIGTMVWMLHKQPPGPHDKDNPARRAIGSSIPGEILDEFAKRFGVEIIEAYGMTECSVITAAPAGSTVPGRIGKAIPEIDVTIVNDVDAPVTSGDIGELVFRPHAPSAMMQGYWAKPEATVEAWRNLWFHTGDLVREDSDGYLEYIGRKKDSIRRRGENVSAWEVEQAVLTHPGVLEAAAIGVPSDVGEEDVAVLVVRAGEVEAAELVDFVAVDLPRFAVPRFVEFVDALPKTPSERIEKGKVRERGISAAAWDAHERTRADAH